MADDAVVLDSGWTFREVEPSELTDFAARSLPNPLSNEGWIPACVPGHVHLDLAQAGELPDLNAGANERRAWGPEKTDFLYRTTFPLPEQWQKSANGEERRVMLAFDSLDTYASIYLNGECIHDSMNWFLPVRMDVTDHLRPGENALLVHFDSAVRRAGVRESEYGRLEADWDRSRVYNRRPQYLTGSPVSPRISGCGFPGKVTLRLLDRLRLRHLNVPVVELTSNSARVNIESDIEAFIPNEVDIHCTIERLEPVGSGTNYRSALIDEKRKVFSVKAGTFRFAHKANIESAVLWWPLGHGPEGLNRRTLYRARVVARIEGEIVDDQECLFGLRSVQLVSEGVIEGFHFRINGQPIYVRGATWLPPSMYPGSTSDDDIRRMLDMAAAANINLLRVWGGGIYERDAFYRRCDELGIMVWQEFPFTRGDYPDYQAFWQNVQREAASHIRRLRTHPSLVLLCGNDEKTWWDEGKPAGDHHNSGQRLFTRLLPRLAEEYAPAVPYLPSTPSGPVKANDPRDGDYHSDVWDAWDPPERYREIEARFVSRFGFQALPDLRTIRKWTNADDVSLNHPELDAHQKQPEGNARILRHVFAKLRPPETLDELVYMSQWIQARAITTAVDVWRARRPATMGSILWHFNDCWPGITWSIVDHSLRPKLAYWALRQAYAPVSIVFLPEGDDAVRAIVVNDGRRWDGNRGLVFRVKAYRHSGELIDWRDVELDVPVDGRADAGIFSYASLGIDNPADGVIAGELCSGQTVVASGLHLPVEPRRAKFAEPQLEARLDCIVAKRRAVIVVRSKNIVCGVEIGFRDLDGAHVRFDNAFDIWPSREVWVNATVPGDVPEQVLMRSLQFRCLNDSAPGRRIEWRPLPLEKGEGRAETHSNEQINVSPQLRMTDVVRKLQE